MKHYRRVRFFSHGVYLVPVDVMIRHNVAYVYPSLATLVLHFALGQTYFTVALTSGYIILYYVKSSDLLELTQSVCVCVNV